MTTAASTRTNIDISDLQQVLADNPELSTWKGHLTYRMQELLRLSEVGNFQTNEKVLEIGCGNGLAACYLAPATKQIVATDLPEEDHEAHSIGLDRAEKLIGTMNLSNVELKGASAMDLPFEAESFDAAYSLYVLEHVPDRQRTLEETARVLKPGGRFIAAVPCLGWSLFYPPAFYLWAIRQVIAKVRTKLQPTKPLPEAIAGNGQQSAASANPPAPSKPAKRPFFQRYPLFPLPPPHGEYRSYFDEAFRQTPGNWRYSFRHAGFQNIEIFSHGILPKGLVGEVFGEKGIEAFKKYQHIDERLQNINALQPIAQFLFIRATKS